ncbi:AfsR/SARP family transcriptional regulator [Plantactinospora sonchi]|uniref:BTAD domain-containing putative transcriptional regulator n=1 Tax=Plantactinospora sonchi TaxID=1544735 RepID=A0ABU7RXT4_9ACTN
MELLAGGRVLALGPPKQRAVLAALAVDAGRPVPVGTLVDRVWDEAPPAEARNALYAHIMRIRRTLAEAARLDNRPFGLVRRAGGYLLDVDRNLIDLHRFRGFIEQARAPGIGDRERAAFLRRALDRWQGLPLAGLSGSWAARIRDGCHQQRLDASVAWAQAELRLGNHEEVITHTYEALAEYPLSEPLALALIRALHATGRTAEALECYARIRQQLADELGIDPGADLRLLHERILREEPAGSVPPRPTGTSPGPRVSDVVAIPAQLPREVPGFVGRTEQLARLDSLLTATVTAGGTPAALVCALSGTAGVGKTALAVHWAHRVAGRFPDGQLYVDLRGFSPSERVISPAEAVRGFLDTLGVPPGRIPPTLDAQGALYRSLLAGRRMLVVLDNARDAEQVRPLLPGTPTAVVVVTSRDLLTPLVAVDGAHPLVLDVLSVGESRKLLGHRLGTDRIAAEPEAVEQIIGACVRLPLALAVAAAHAQQTSFPLAAHAAELDEAGQRLNALDGGDAASQVRAVFSWSYTSLTPSAAWLFRLLSLHPGPDISVPAVASLSGRSLARCRQLLTELVRANLLAEHVPGRYTFHDLLRTYATELAHSHRAGDDHPAAGNRMFDHYVHTANAADRLLSPYRDPIRLPLAPLPPGSRPEPLADHHAAMAWLTSEHRVLIAVLRQASEVGLDTHAWQLAWALTTFLYRQGHWHDQHAAWRVALSAARRLGDPAAQGDAHRILGRCDARLGRHGDAHIHLRRALHLYGQVDDVAGRADTHADLAYLRDRQGHLEDALDHAQRALALHQAAGDDRGQAYALNGLGWHHALLGDHTQARVYCERALALLQRLGDRSGEAATWDSLGYAHHHLGDYAEAAGCYRRALTLRRDLGARYVEATTLGKLGDTQQAAGDHAAARVSWRQSLVILQELGHPDADDMRAKLGQPQRRTGP